MKAFGLIGNSLQHSFSPSYFNRKFKELGLSDCTYRSFEMNELSELRRLINDNSDLIGLNVTIPFKEKVIPYLDELDPLSEAIAAVNTIVIRRQNGIIHTKGYNTDVYGFEALIKPFLKYKPKRALVLGSGGASKAVHHGLNSLDILYTTVSRHPTASELSYEDLNSDIIEDHELIINTTPLGMYPKIDRFPEIPYEGLSENNIMVDLIYNPEKTAFLVKGEAAGCKISNGLPMLIAQAEASWEIWNSI